MFEDIVLTLWQAQRLSWLVYGKTTESLCSSGWGRLLCPDSHFCISLGPGHSHKGIQRHKWT